MKKDPMIDFLPMCEYTEKEAFALLERSEALLWLYRHTFIRHDWNLTPKDIRDAAFKAADEVRREYPEHAAAIESTGENNPIRELNGLVYGLRAALHGDGHLDT